MKTILKKSVGCRVSGDKAASASRFTPHVSSLNPGKGAWPRGAALRGFTLVEMLVVIAIIAILAALLLPALAGATKARQKKQASIEISQIVGAIQQYDSVYGRFPVSANAQTAAAKGNGDFTYGAVFQTPTGPGTIANGGDLRNVTYPTNNCEVIAILMNYTNYPNNPSLFTANTNYQKNPQQTIFLNAKMSGYDPSDPTQKGAPLPGVGNDLVYRDPWGNPYVISMDLNYDEQCQDAFYCLGAVSSGDAGLNKNPGLNGLVNPDNTTADTYRYHGKVMVWSAGPDGKIDAGAPANKSVNKDNILSWQ